MPLLEVNKAESLHVFSDPSPDEQMKRQREEKNATHFWLNMKIKHVANTHEDKKNREEHTLYSMTQ